MTEKMKSVWAMFLGRRSCSTSVPCALNPLPCQPPEPMAVRDCWMFQPAPSGSAVGIEKGRQPLVLEGFEQVRADGHDRHDQQHERQQVAQRDAADEEHGQHHRPPHDDAAQLRLRRHQQARRTRDQSAEQQLEHRVHPAVFAQEQRDDHDTPEDGELRGLQADAAEFQPAFRAVVRVADELAQHQQPHARDVHGQRAPLDPAVVHQARRDEDRHARRDPHRLLAGRLRQVRGRIAHERRRVDGDDAAHAQRDHERQQHPVEAEKLAEVGIHGIELGNRRYCTGKTVRPQSPKAPLARCVQDSGQAAKRSVVTLGRDRSPSDPKLSASGPCAGFKRHVWSRKVWDRLGEPSPSELDRRQQPPGVFVLRLPVEGLRAGGLDDPVRGTGRAPRR